MRARDLVHVPLNFASLDPVYLIPIHANDTHRRVFSVGTRAATDRCYLDWKAV